MVFFKKITDITEDSLDSARLIILDLDNTLVTPETTNTTPQILAWLSGVKKNHKCLILSNSRSLGRRKETVERIFGCPVFENENSKPSRLLFEAIRARHGGVLPQNVLVIGDRLFTDALFAKINGARAILVEPLVVESRFFFRLAVYAEKIVSYFLKFSSR